METDFKSKKVSELTKSLTSDFGNELYFLATDASNSKQSYFRSLRVSYGQISSLLENRYDSHIILSCENISNALTVDINSISTTLTDDITTNRHEITSINLLLHDTSDMLSIEIRDLSDNLSNDISKISTDISTDIENLSTALSTDIKLSVEQLYDDYTTVIHNVSIQVKTDISTEIDKVSTYIVDNISSIAPAATNEIPGVVKCKENDIDNNYYGLRVDQDGCAYVYVPNGGGGGSGEMPPQYEQVLSFLIEGTKTVGATFNLYKDFKNICDNTFSEHTEKLDHFAQVSAALYGRDYIIGGEDDPEGQIGYLLSAVQTLQDIFDLIYPINSIYISYAKELPDIFDTFGSWQRLATGRCLWSADDDGNDAGTKIEAGLPTPTITLKNVNCTEVTPTINATTTANALVTLEVNLIEGGTQTTVIKSIENGSVDIKENAHKHDITAELNFTDPFDVYGKSKSVQPPAIVVSMWRRVK